MKASEKQMLQEIEALADSLFTTGPEDLKEIDTAMSYSLLAGGKRLRALIPCMVLQAHKKNWRIGLYPALALECVHTYSLIHDDLPCMDNDDYRRGKLTNHKVFGEAVALLAGDGLLTEAFLLLSRGQFNQDYSPKQACFLAETLSKAAGRYGMIGGQLLDIHADVNRTIERLQRMHRLKTGALLEASFVMGADLATDDSNVLDLWREVGKSFGILFQIQDDLLDVIGDPVLMGKAVGRDLTLDKWTYVKCFGVIETQRLLEDEYANLLSILDKIPADTEQFSDLFARLKNRKQ
jgi:geranylgeranyl diphosphate synthase type II